MAFILSNYKSEFGITHEAAYANIDSYYVNLINKVCKVNVTIYASLKSRENEDTPVGFKTYVIKGSEFIESLEATEFILRDTDEIPVEEVDIKKGVTNIATSNMYTRLQSHKDFISATPIFFFFFLPNRKEISMKEVKVNNLAVDEDFEIVDSLG